MGRLVPLGLVALTAAAALLPVLRPGLLAGLLVAYLVVRRRDGGAVLVLAALLPAAAILAWGLVPQPVATPSGADCAALASAPALYRLVEGLVSLALTGALVLDARRSWREIGVTGGPRWSLVLSAAAFAMVAPVAVLLGGFIGGIFFRAVTLDLSQPAAILPAFLFAAGNAVAEEVAYRGAMRAWLTPALGPIAANVAQAVVFGLAHTGGDFVGPAAPVVVAMIGVGFLGGVVARRTGSLMLVTAVHVAADVPIYLYWACSLAT